MQLFAGGGGASEGEVIATGRSPDIAINHSPVAIAMHRANHPSTQHFIEDVYAVDPREATGGRRVQFLWMSPTCTHFSRAKGASLRDQKIRGLAWSVLPWIKHCRPEIIVLENVPEFLTWGPVCRRHADDCADGGHSDGTGCSKGCAFGKPIKERAGQTYRAWREKIVSKGYSFEARKLIAWEYGAPTTRERLYIVMRADGQPATWPMPTHAKDPTPARPHRWRTAAEIIDWSIPCPSIFERSRALVAKTEARIVRGVGKFVLENNRPFVIPVNHGGVGRRDHRVHDLDAPMPTVTGGQRGGHALVAPMVVKAKTHGGGGNDAMSAEEPLRTITASKRGEFAVAVPYLIHRSNGERPGQAPRTYDINAPHPTVVSGGLKTSVVAAFLAKHYSERRPGEVLASDVDAPVGTVTAQDHHALVAASLVKFYGTSTGQQIELPLGTVTSEGWKHGLAVSFLSRYNGQSVGQVADAPIGTLDARDRYAVMSASVAEWDADIERRARRVYRLMVKHGYKGRGLDHENQLVTVVVDCVALVIYDLGMRMLTPRELFRAQGFEDSYVIDPVGPRGKRLTKTEQIRACGNSVCPPVAAAIVRAVLKAA